MIARRSALLCSCLVVVLLVGGLVPANERKYVPSGPPRGARADARPENEVGPAYYIYEDKSVAHQASGWMPGGDIALSHTLESTDTPRRGKYCYRAECNLKDDPWMGVA